KEELQALGAQVGYNIADPIRGFDCARSIVSQHPYSFAAWNCYYKVVSRLDNRYPKHSKFLNNMRIKHKRLHTNYYCWSSVYHDQPS
ncbi:hypothetical protein HAX54_009838, partial [Datura stramonium]|nr:hypothetical protein [Datura stramonium]